MNCILSSFLSPSLILLSPQLTLNLDVSAAIILLLICYTLHCVKDFSFMALLQANKKKPRKYFFPFIATHTHILSMAQGIMMRKTIGWQLGNKCHSNKNRFCYTYHILLEYAHLNGDTVWGLLSQGISYGPLPPAHTLCLYTGPSCWICMHFP